MTKHFHKKNIIIVEDETVINSSSFLKKIEKYGDIFICFNNHVQKFPHNSSNKKIIKIITYKELLDLLAGFEDYPLEYFYSNGLDKNTNPNSSISIITSSNKKKSKLLSYDFSYTDKETNKTKYEIPYLHHEVPEGFSVFCTDEENKLIYDYLKKKKLKSNENAKDKNKEDYAHIAEPVPNKTNFICQLCRMRFDNFKDHITSELHKKNQKKHKHSYSRLSHTFKRIINENSKSKSRNSSRKKENVLRTVSSQFSCVSTLLSSQPDVNLPSYANENLGYNLRGKKNPSCEKISKSRIVQNKIIFVQPEDSTSSNVFKNEALIEKEDEKILTKRTLHKRKRNEMNDFVFDPTFKNLREKNPFINLSKKNK